MVYQPNIPLSTDKLRISQGDLNTNFGDLDTVFDVDHYKYSDATGDIGKHSQITTPKESAHPSTSADEPKLYAIDIGNGDILQVSRFGGDGKTAGVTAIHGGPLTAGTDTLITCTSLNRAILEMYGFNDGSATLFARASVMWDGSAFVGITGATILEEKNTGAAFQFRVSGDNVTFVHTVAGNVFFTLHIRRLDP